jgi:hypothetical protein
MMKWDVWTFFPSREIRRKSVLFRSRSFLGKPDTRYTLYFEEMVTASRFRPLARLLLMTSRPFLEDIRTRNPWVLFRDVLLG